MIPKHVTPETYADYLVALVKADIESEPQRFGGARSWTDLHDVCDANEYLIDADAFFQLSEDDFGTDERIALANEAVAIAERRLFMNRIGVTRKNEVLLNGHVVGSVMRVGHNLYDALNADGEVVAASCYGNGGAKHVAASILCSRLGLLSDGMRYLNVNAKDEWVGGGPYTVDNRRTR